MNPLIAMGFNPPNPVAAYTGGVEAKGIVDDRQNQNALRGYIQQNGAGIMSGDQNALAGLGGMGPRGLEMAMGVQNQQLSQEATRQGMAIDRERLGLARQQAAQQAAQAARQMSAQEAAQSAAELERIGGAATVAYQQGPEAFQSFMAQYANVIPEEFQGINYENAPYAIAMVTGLTEGFQQEIAKPQTSIAKLESDRANGLITEEQYALGLEALKPSGMAIDMGADGGFSLRQGAGVTSGGKPLTEGQSKNVIYATRAEGALPLLDSFGDALTSYAQTATTSDPTGLARVFQSPEFQQARQAGDEFLQAVLRKDTGAAITPAEMDEYGRTYLPQPGDTQEVLAQKKNSRARAIEAMRRGMTPTEIIALEKPSAASGEWMTTTDVTTWTDEQMDEAERAWGLK